MMARYRKNAIATSVYVTEECLRLIEFLSVREEVTQVVFIRRAIRYFLSGDKKIDSRIMITKWSDPQYIRRNALMPIYIDCEQKKELEDVAAEQGGKFSQAFFQAMISYCALLITIDDTGIEVVENI
jgi:hypothetical protein